MPDTITEVKAILARTLRELEQVIDNAEITSFLRSLGRVLGLDADSATATKPTSPRQPTAKPKRVTASRASTAKTARVPQPTTTTTEARTRTPAKPASTHRVSSSPSRARAGARRDQLLALVAAQPGITLAQAATQFGLKDATSLYAVARRLQDDGLVHKSGVELHPTAEAQPK